MTWADDQLYDGYVRRNMVKLVNKVKVREILPHLACLTSHDLETIQATCEMRSNQDAVVHLLDCLKRRENWPDEFIEALEACGYRTIAADIQTEYNKLKYSRHGSPKTTSPKSAANHLSPVNLASSPSAESLTRQESPQRTTSQVPQMMGSPPSPPRTPETLQHHGTPEQARVTTFQVPQMMTPSPPPPRTPQTLQHQETPPAAAVVEIRVHQEPEENSFIQTPVVTPDRVRRDDAVNPDQSSQEARINESEDAASKIAFVTPPRRADPNISSPLADSYTPEEVSYQFRTLDKPPVQETTPPVAAPATFARGPEQPLQPLTEKVRGKDWNTTNVTVNQRLPADEANTCADTSVLLSKPTQLCSIRPPNQADPPLDSAPFSNLVHLEISNNVQQTPTSTPVGAPSLSLQDEREIVVQVSEEPPRLNMAGQSPLRPLMNVNSEMSSSTRMAAAESESHEKEPAGSLATQGNYLLPAVGIAACALLVTLWLKH